MNKTTPIGNGLAKKTSYERIGKSRYARRTSEIVKDKPEILEFSKFFEKVQ